MNPYKIIKKSLLFATKGFVSNISKKKFSYSFEVGSARQLHPTRQLSDGTDRLTITSNLLAITDHGTGNFNEKFSQNLDGDYANKLHAVINSFFYTQMQKYLQNPVELVASAVNSIKIEGNCTLTLVMVHPQTGEVVFYYIGDTLYGIFKQKQIVMVEGQFEGFNQAYKIGPDHYSPSTGFTERYLYDEIKDQLILAASNGLWNNVHLDLLHFQVRGSGSYVSPSKEEQPSKRKQQKHLKSFQQIADRVSKIGAFYSRKGKYESPFFKMGKRHGVEVPMEGFLDDISVILAQVKRSVEIK